MTRTKLRTSLVERAARVAEKRACLVCAASGDKIPGHEMCWAYVEIAREIPLLGGRFVRVGYQRSTVKKAGPGSKAVFNGDAGKLGAVRDNRRGRVRIYVAR